MKLGLLSLSLAALLCASLLYPSSAMFLFPGEVPTSEDVEDLDRPTPLRSSRPPERQYPGGGRFLDSSSEKASEELSAELHSVRGVEFATASLSYDGEAAESVEDTADKTDDQVEGGLSEHVQPDVPRFDLVEPEFGKSDIEGKPSKHTAERPRVPTSSDIASVLREDAASESSESVETDFEEFLGSDRTATVNLTSSYLDAVTSDSTPAENSTSPDVNSLIGEEVTVEPVPFASLHLSTPPETLHGDSEAPSAVSPDDSRVSDDQSLPVSNDLLFPGSHDLEGWAEDSHPLPTCDGKRVSAIHPATGQCQLLGVASNCPDGQFFLLSVDGTDPGCRPLPCPLDQLLVGDACLPTEHPTACPHRMTLVRDERGRGRCVCKTGHVLWPADQRCYPALTQGPCSVGNYLTAAWDEPEPRCASNPCMLDGSWLWLQPPEIGCFPLLEPDDGCESSQMLKLEDGRLVCEGALFRGIFDLPDVKCGASSLMDHGGNCRRPLTQSFRGY